VDLPLPGRRISASLCESFIGSNEFKILSAAKRKGPAGWRRRRSLMARLAYRYIGGSRPIALPVGSALRRAWEGPGANGRAVPFGIDPGSLPAVALERLREAVSGKTGEIEARHLADYSGGRRSHRACGPLTRARIRLRGRQGSRFPARRGQSGRVVAYDIFRAASDIRGARPRAAALGRTNIRMSCDWATRCPDEFEACERVLYSRIVLQHNPPPDHRPWCCRS